MTPFLQSTRSATPPHSFLVLFLTLKSLDCVEGTLQKGCWGSGAFANGYGDCAGFHELGSSLFVLSVAPQSYQLVFEILVDNETKGMESSTSASNAMRSLKERNQLNRHRYAGSAAESGVKD